MKVENSNLKQNPGYRKLILIRIFVILWGEEENFNICSSLYFYKFIVSVKSTVNTINNTGFMDELIPFRLIFAILKIKTMKIQKTHFFSSFLFSCFVSIWTEPFYLEIR